MFSLSYLFRPVSILVHNPSMVSHLRHGSTSAGEFLERSRKERWEASPVPIRHVHGFNICLQKADVEGVSPSIGVTGTYEPHVTQLFRKLLRPGMTVLDIGANIGWYTLTAASKIGPEGHVLAFEPEPSSFSLLSKSIKLNLFKNALPVAEAVSDTIEPQTLHLSRTNLGAHSMVSRVGGESVTVPSTTLDKVLSRYEIQHVDLLKIDVEGAEPRAIMGGPECLRKTDHVIMEWNSKEWENRPDALKMISYGFTVHEIVKSPFLIKRRSWDSLRNVPRTNLYLRRILG